MTIFHQFNWFILLLIVSGTSSCKNNKDKVTTSKTQIEVVELSEDFVVFYEKFQSDSVYQMNHIIFPLQGIPSMIDSTVDVVNYRWKRDSWKLHKAFNDYNGTYRREFDNFKDIITERIFDTGYRFEMIRRYSKINGEWHLIYYAGMNHMSIYG